VACLCPFGLGGPVGARHCRCQHMLTVNLGNIADCFAFPPWSFENTVNNQWERRVKKKKMFTDIRNTKHLKRPLHVLHKSVILKLTITRTKCHVCRIALIPLWGVGMLLLRRRHWSLPLVGHFGIARRLAGSCISEADAKNIVTLLRY
jgi:hypothetical protein